MRILSPNSVMRLLPRMEREILADSPLAWWKLDEASSTTGFDSISTNHITHSNGPMVNQASLVADGTGRSVSYDGVNDSSKVANPIFSSIVEFTVEMIWRSPPTIVNYDHLIEVGNEGNGFYIRTMTASSRIEIGVVGGTNYAAFAVATNTTYHVAAMRRAGVLYIYLNGVEGTGIAETATSTPTGFVALMSRPVTAFGFCQGRLQHVALYAQPLTAARVLARAQAAGLA